MKLIIHDNWHEGVRTLPAEQQGEFYASLARYVFEGAEPAFQGVLAAVWAVVKPFIDQSIEHQENGAKGGNGRGNKGLKTPLENPPIKPPVKPPSKTPLENQIRIEKELKGKVEESLKDSSTIPTSAGAGGDSPAPRPGWVEIVRREQALFDADERERISKAERDMAEQARIVAENQAGAVPCPASVIKAVRDA